MLKTIIADIATMFCITLIIAAIGMGVVSAVAGGVSRALASIVTG